MHSLIFIIATCLLASCSINIKNVDAGKNAEDQQTIAQGTNTTGKDV